MRKSGDLFLRLEKPILNLKRLAQRGTAWQIELKNDNGIENLP